MQYNTRSDFETSFIEELYGHFELDLIKKQNSCVCDNMENYFSSAESVLH